MAYVLTHQDRVLYSCTCSQLSTLGELFFCRHCKQPRCQDCVSSTIESFSCPHCFEAAMTDALKSKKGRCSRCFQCPQCFTTLTTRSVIVPSEVLGDQAAQKGDKLPTTPRSASSAKSPGGTKLYYLSCSHCKWSTRDVGIKDKRSPIDFKDRRSPHQPRFDSLVSFYKEYAANDNAVREKTKKSVSSRRSQRAYSSLLDPTKFVKGVAGSESPQIRRGSSQLTWTSATVDKMAAVASDPEPPPEHLYSEEIDLEQIPTLEQQLKDPVFQPQHTKDLAPSQLRLTGKKLHRCKGCEHILMKAELNLNSIRFKIQQAAIHSFPQVRIVECRPLVSDSGGEMMEAILSITNPLNYGVTVSFSQCSPEEGKRIKETLAGLSLPEGEFFLSPNDDVLEFLEGEGGDSDVKDDPRFVEQRLPGKLFLKFQVAPETKDEGGGGGGGRGGGGRRIAKIMFRMGFTHKSTVEADQENDTCTVSVPVLVRLSRPKSA